MASQLDICNMALANIGCLPIQSLTDNSESSRLLMLNYDRCLDSVLREFPWNFATCKTQLVKAAETSPDYRFSYAYPYNCMRLYSVYYIPEKPEEFEVRASRDGTMKLIVTNAPEACASYTVRVQDTTLYDPSFVEALAYKLSYEINNAKTNNGQLTQEMGSRYTQAIMKAYRDSAVESRTQTNYPSSYISARR